MFSQLKPDSATEVGIITAAGVYLIYQNALPNVTDIRSAAPHDNNVEGARRAAAWKSAALIAVVFLVARDLNSFIISGVGLVGIDAMYKHSNGIHPGTGKLDVANDGQSIAPGLAQAYPMPEYADAG